jgi:hypothetical protein
MTAETTAEATAPPTVKPVVEAASAPARPWHVIGPEELVVALMAAGGEPGVFVKESDGTGIDSAAEGAVIFLDCGDAAREAKAEALVATGVPVVAIVPEPTVAAVLRLVRLGVADILAGKPSSADVATRRSRWTAKAPGAAVKG